MYDKGSQLARRLQHKSQTSSRQEAASRAGRDEPDLAGAIPEHKDNGAGADEGVEAEEEARGAR